MAILLVSIGVLIGIVGLSMMVLRPRQRRKNRERIQAEPFPSEWEEIITRRCDFYPKLTPEFQQRLREHVQVFLSEKKFEACGDLEKITTEMKVIIAAQACLLLIGLKQHSYFQKLRSVLLYPGAFRRGGKGVFSLAEDDDSVLLGESWVSGSVILAWKSALRGVTNEDDGQNVILHEFAHQLDQVDGVADGAPILNSRADYKDWARVLGRDFEKLVKETESGKRELIDSYGATNPAEFFAVATETFFEKPRRLLRKHRELYDELKQYYGLDPAAWRKPR